MTQQDTETLLEFSRVLWGAHVCRVQPKIQHCFEGAHAAEFLDDLRLDFNEPLPVPQGIRKHRSVGSLWIGSSSGVRLEQGGRILAGSGDSVAKVLDRFRRLAGNRLLKVEVRAPGGDTAFHFENDLTLVCFPASAQKGDAWIVSTEDGNRLKLGPGSRVTYETGLR
jgi:hypothetical protein